VEFKFSTPLHLPTVSTAAKVLLALQSRLNDNSEHSNQLGLFVFPMAELVYLT
jgi:hypothetical protein